MYSANVKSEVINNIIFAMSDYLDVVTLDVLKKSDRSPVSSGEHGRDYYASGGGEGIGRGTEPVLRKSYAH